MTYTIHDIIGISAEASNLVMKFYNDKSAKEYTKSDGSELTDADKGASDLIIEKLSKLDPDATIISEETVDDFGPRYDFTKLERFWIVDPIDGTAGFVDRTGHFTVNIALVENGEVILGVVGVPAENVIYFAEKGKGAWKIDRSNGKTTQVHTTDGAAKHASGKEIVNLAVSRRMNSPVTTMQNISSFVTDNDMLISLNIDGSYKMCLIAEGKVDATVKSNTIHEWDTAAPQIVVTEAGGFAINADDHTPMTYGKEGLKTPPHIMGAPWIKERLIS